MSIRSEALYSRLTSEAEIFTLIGTAEDGDLDFKEWRKPEANRGSLSKAACAFANANGGVIVVGVQAKSPRSGDPDVAQGVKPVENPEAVKASILDIVLRGVEPGIEGVQARAVLSTENPSEGYVVLHIPENPIPQRSRVDHHYYVRMGSSSVPMETFQIADRYGRRPQPKLEAHVIDLNNGTPYPFSAQNFRSFKIHLRNVGRGVAQHATLFYLSETSLATRPDQTITVQSNPTNTAERWLTVRGGVDSIVFPGESRPIIELYQSARIEQGLLHWPQVILRTRVVCLEMAQYEQELIIESNDKVK